MPVALVLATLTIVLAVLVSVKFLSYSDSLIDRTIHANAQSLKSHLASSKDRTRAAAVSMAANPETINAIKSRCPVEIFCVFEPAIDLYRIDFFTIADDSGVVLLRTHERDNFGDSVLNIQSFRNALEGEVSSHFDAGVVAKVSARTGAPVHDTDGSLIGVISAGVRLDTNEAVDRLKTHFDTEVTVVLGDTRIATTVIRDGRRINGTVIDNPKLIKVLTEDKREYFGNVNVAGTINKVFGIPLLDAKGEPFAAVLIGAPLSELYAESNALIRNVVIVSVVGLFIAMLVLYRVISSISEPLAMLSEGMNNIENGDLNVDIHTETWCEIGRAGKAMQKMAETIQKLITEINVAISEHEKGNTDYRLDGSVFYGDYRLLADQVMKLSNLGMTDQLTKLPNRRSFDRRLEMEWGRAIREKAPLSILMMDVDHFKAYNDAYGHQQGDVALQAVADVLSKSIGRAADFTARWGGEEFVALLPSTDSDGALYVAEKVRETIESVEILCVEKAGAKKVTISIGVNTQIPSPEDTVEKLIAGADAALYHAKKTGRNKVCSHEANT